MSESIRSLLNRLWQQMSLRRHRQLVLLLLLMLAATLAEILSLGSILPFLGILTSPERIYDLSFAHPILKFFNYANPNELLLPITIIFGVAVTLAGFTRLLLIWASTKISFAIGADLSIDIYRRALHQPYQVHCSTNSSEVINGILVKTNGVIYNVILPTLTLISSSIMLIAVLSVFLIMQPWIALSIVGGFGMIYFVIISLSRRKLQIDSECVTRESTLVIKILQEGLGGIRDVLLDGSQEAYCNIYRRSDLALRGAQSRSLFLIACPRYGMEALGMLLIAALAYSLAKQPNGIVSAIPILGALALGAQRLLPVLQQAYSSVTQINSAKASLQETIEVLEKKLPNDAFDVNIKKLPFSEAISLKKISFRYAESASYVIKNVDLVIKKGSRIGFIGTTGSGKSTLIDIVMGLLQPSDGVIAIDDQNLTNNNSRSWQAHIAHVPQTIFLADSSIAENIAFGVAKDEIEHGQVKRAAKQAQISEIIESWPDGYETRVGERGIRLSGGQRQRIGIARALYRNADVIIFDEATSALDTKTEQAVMDSIAGLSNELTIIIIAHRITTLKNCQKIVELSHGSIKRIASYDEILNETEKK